MYNWATGLSLMFTHQTRRIVHVVSSQMKAAIQSRIVKIMSIIEAK